MEPCLTTTPFIQPTRCYDHNLLIHRISARGISYLYSSWYVWYVATLCVWYCFCCLFTAYHDKEKHSHRFNKQRQSRSTHMSFPTDFSCSIGSNSTFLREHNNSSSLLLACKGIKHRMVFVITRFKFLFVAILTSFISPFTNTNFMLCFMTVSNWLFQFETNQRLTKVNITTSQT